MTDIAHEHKHKTVINPYNIGFFDRSFRFIIGGIMLGSVFYLSPTTTFSMFGVEFVTMKILALVSIYPLATAWIGHDPIFSVLSIDSQTRLKEDKCGDLVDQVKTAITARSS